VGESNRGLIKGSQHLTEGSEKTHENLCQDSQSPGRDLSSGPPG
jgi:hypothetical protein